MTTVLTSPVTADLRGHTVPLDHYIGGAWVPETERFAVYDPADATTFARVIAAVSIRDNVWVEGSAALFTGSSLDVIGRLTNRDFAYARLKVFF